MQTEQAAVDRLTRDLASGAVTLDRDEARFLVDEYYAMQEQRIRGHNQVRAMSEEGEPHAVLAWYAAQSSVLEQQVKRALTKYAEGHPVGEWMLSIRGIGPVLAAGLLAHLDVSPWRCAKASLKVKPCKPGEPCTEGCGHRRTTTVGKWWRFAGLDPTSKWESKKARPWNARLKTLCWKIGESFVKTKAHEEGFYGAIYEQRKAYEQAQNDAGAYKEQAQSIAESRPGHAQVATYKAGKLPDGHIHARSKRYAVKLFLAHLHEVWYQHEFGEAPPMPYALSHLGHADKIPVPNAPSRGSSETH